jgi:ComF family protein
VHKVLTHSVRGWLEAALAFAYPEVCQICSQGRATPAESYVCESCRDGVRRIERPFCERCGRPFEGAITTSFTCGNCEDLDLKFVFARSAVASVGAVRDALHRYKYERAMWFEPLLAQWLVEAAAAGLRGQGWDRVVPVPLYPTRHREREFNQAEHLARHLSAATGIPVESRAVRRVLPTKTQTHLSRTERLANVRGAFAMRRGFRFRGERIVLVDDVFTTGATTSSCAGSLLAGGAAEVCVWTLARGV